MTKFVDGPFIQAACFCDMVIQEASGVLSLIRVVDTLTHAEAGPNPPKDMPPFPHTFKLVLMLKAGMARGRSEIRIVPELPNGSTERPLIATAYFEGDEKGQNIVADMVFIFQFEGLYWFNVYLDEAKITAIPLLVKYNRVVTGPASAPPNTP